MATYRVELTRDTLIMGKPKKKGSMINVDDALYNYLCNCLCVDVDVEPEIVRSTPVREVPKPAKVQGKK